MSDAGIWAKRHFRQRDWKMQRPEAGACVVCWRSSPVVGVSEAMRARDKCNNVGKYTVPFTKC